MAGFQINGVDVTAVNLDGQEVTELQLDGVTVWSSAPAGGIISIYPTVEPTSPEVGEVYYNPNLQSAYIWSGTEWKIN